MWLVYLDAKSNQVKAVKYISEEKEKNEKIYIPAKGVEPWWGNPMKTNPSHFLIHLPSSSPSLSPSSCTLSSPRREEKQPPSCHLVHRKFIRILSPDIIHLHHELTVTIFDPMDWDLLFQNIDYQENQRLKRRKLRCF